MKLSQVYIIIANMWLVGSFLIDSILGSFMMIFMGGLWILGAIFTMKAEFEIGRAKRKLKHLMIMEGFEIVGKLLKEMPTK